MNKILGEKLREAIALKKFSLIVPVINGFVKNQDEYFRKLSCKPIIKRKFANATIRHPWLSVAKKSF